LRKSVERGYCESFADYSRDLAGTAKPLPTEGRRLSVVVASPEFRMREKISEFAAIIAKSLQRHCPDGRLS
jgi:IclR family transcriptional regulator, acetate operon repressor